MKKVLAISAIIGMMSAPALSFAQSSGGVTRAQVMADLVRIEQAGYNPSAGEDPNYPADIQAAEAKVAAEDPTNANRINLSESTNLVRKHRSE